MISLVVFDQVFDDSSQRWGGTARVIRRRRRRRRERRRKRRRRRRRNPVLPALIPHHQKSRKRDRDLKVHHDEIGARSAIGNAAEALNVAGNAAEAQKDVGNAAEAQKDVGNAVLRGDMPVHRSQRIQEKCSRSL